MTTEMVKTPVPIHVVTPADADRVVAVLSLAFSTDPAARWVWPDAQRYLASFPAFVQAFGGRAFAHGTAHCLDGDAGAALWLPPGVDPDEEAMVELVHSTASEQQSADVFAVFEQMGRYRPGEPHWYLPMLGVDPAYQGLGHGSALLQHTLAVCDREGALAYLESSNSRNIPLYERHGFKVLGTIQAGGSPTLFPMLRTPR